MIEQINVARGRLRNVLTESLFEPSKTLLDNSSCKCKEATLYQYQMGLWRTGVWPLETEARGQSMSAILAALSKFKFDLDPTACRARCHRDLKVIVDRAQDHTLRYFEGLCLDCLSRSAGSGDVGHGVWSREDCRLFHSENTAYFSWMFR